MPRVNIALTPAIDRAELATADIKRELRIIKRSRTTRARAATDARFDCQLSKLPFFTTDNGNCATRSAGAARGIKIKITYFPTLPECRC